MARRRVDLSTPAIAERRRPAFPLTQDSFGRAAETIARFLGTARYLVIQTVVIILWILFNEVVHAFDAYPYILLTLALSMQASYAAPLILLAQARQEDRDREALERDREQARRTQQDTEYLARELAAIRIALADVVTEADLDRAVERVLEATGGGRRKAKKKHRAGEPLPDGAGGAEVGVGGGGDAADEPPSPS